MENNGNRDRSDIFKTLNKIKKMENFNFALMSREEKVAYIVYQMELAEKQVPDMVEHVEYGFGKDRYQ